VDSGAPARRDKLSRAGIEFDEVRRRARALGADHKPIEAVANETAAEIIHHVDILASGYRRHVQRPQVVRANV
jgi:hypothetical protein